MTIQIFRAKVAGNVPTSLADGQLAIDQFNEVLFYKNAGGTIRSLPLTKLARIGFTPQGDGGYQILASDRTVALTAALTAARTWTLPAANSVPAGTSIRILDAKGGVTAANTLTVATTTGSGNNAADTLNGAASVTFASAYIDFQATSDGASTWTAGITSVVRGGTGSSTATGARSNLGLGTMATQGAGAVAITGGAIDGATIGASNPPNATFGKASGGGQAANVGNTVPALANTGQWSLDWNYSAGFGEIDLFVNRGPGSTGGFYIYDVPNGSGPVTQLLGITGSGSATLMSLTLGTALPVGSGGTGTGTAGGGALDNVLGIAGQSGGGLLTRTGAGSYSFTATSTFAPIASPTFTGTPKASATPAAGDNSLALATTAYADRAAANAASSGGSNSGGSGAPSATIPTTSGTTQVAAAADKGKTYLLAGSSTLQLPPAVQVAGWYAWVKKSDGNGAWSITPTASSGTPPTIDGLASITCYQESYLVWWDNAAGVFRTQDRPKGPVSMGRTTVSSAMASVGYAVSDPEMLNLKMTGSSLTFSGNDSPALQVQKSGSWQTSGYRATEVGGYNSSSYVSQKSGPLFGSNVSGTADISFEAFIGNFGSTSPQRLALNVFGLSGSQSSASNVQGAHDGTAAAITAVQIYGVNGNNVTGGVFNLEGYRP